jgi:hypothetical protein
MTTLSFSLIPIPVAHGLMQKHFRNSQTKTKQTYVGRNKTFPPLHVTKTLFFTPRRS